MGGFASVGVGLGPLGVGVLRACLSYVPVEMWWQNGWLTM